MRFADNRIGFANSAMRGGFSEIEAVFSGFEKSEIDSFAADSLESLARERFEKREDETISSNLDV